eukprot:TRINITY_DN32449_c0_g1_i2.p1 TRINITY_DN32449_c0_g1~~TRINITY_DN32449_c0_g1_i2.p1  ORF type:complete len:155 (-),score=24.95 TRINITY_DN32449_c0_g1_i2:27-491(-)
MECTADELTARVSAMETMVDQLREQLKLSRETLEETTQHKDAIISGKDKEIELLDKQMDKMREKFAVWKPVHIVSAQAAFSPGTVRETLTASSRSTTAIHSCLFWPSMILACEGLHCTVRLAMGIWRRQRSTAPRSAALTIAEALYNTAQRSAV